MLRSADGRKLLVNAKYKFSDAGSGSINNTDIYEGWAFMKATGIIRLVLLYPYVGKGGAAHFEEFQHVYDESCEITGACINTYLAGVDGLASFAKELAFEMEPPTGDLSYESPRSPANLGISMNGELWEMKNLTNSESSVNNQVKERESNGSSSESMNL